MDISFILGFLPYMRMPKRYILAENQVKPMDDIYKNPMESSISHKGTSNGTRTIMTIGEVKGIMEHQKANGPSGFSML